MKIFKWLLIIPLVVAATFSSCKKEVKIEIPSPPIPTISADFYTNKTCHNLVLSEDVQLIDSSLNFINSSDTNSKASYKWDFGDNTFSSDINPSHTFTLPGIYNVRLFTFYNNIASDTAEKNITILIGQRQFKKWRFTQLIDGDLNSENGVIAVLSGYSNSYNDPASYAILFTDSLLKLKWIRQISGNSSRLSSIQKNTANEYILSGNFEEGNTDEFSISKLNSSGEHLWTKFITRLQGNNLSTIETTDKGYLTIGYTGINPRYVAIVKCDANGNEVFRKIFNTGSAADKLILANNIIETSTGYLFGAITNYNTDLVLTNIDFSGNIIKQGRVPVSNSTGSIFGVGISKSSTGYLLNLVHNSNCYFFDNDFTSVGFKAIGNSSVNYVLSWNNNYYSAEGDHQYSYIQKLTDVGAVLWSYGTWNYIIQSCSAHTTGATRYGRKVIKGLNDFIGLSDGEDELNDYNSSSIYLERISLTGEYR